MTYLNLGFLTPRFVADLGHVGLGRRTQSLKIYEILRTNLEKISQKSTGTIPLSA